MSEYTVVAFEDADDVMGDYPGEMRFLKGPLETEEVAVTYRRMPPDTGGRGSYGHRHKEQEEVYVVLAGELDFKLNDDVITVGAHQAVRVPRDTWRSVHNTSDADAELLIVSTRLPGDQGDHETIDDFWPRDGDRG